MEALSRTITLKDIAARIGVSTTAISHVLNEEQRSAAGRKTVRVSAETRRRVLEAVRDLNYVPQLRARSMITRRSYAIAVLASFSPNTLDAAGAVYFNSALRGVEEVCKKANHHCLYASCEFGDPDAFVEPRVMRDGSVDGVVLIGQAAPGVAERLGAMGLPCVQVGSNVDPWTGIEAVYADLDDGVERLCRRWVALGHRRVEFFMPHGPGPDKHLRAFAGLAGKIAGLEPIPRQPPEKKMLDRQGMDRAREMLRQASPPTVILCSPFHAAGIVSGMEEAGRTFPNDYSLAVLSAEETGELRLGRSQRAVGGMTFSIREVARRAAGRLFEMLGVSDPGAERINPRVPCSIVDGASWGPPPG